VSSRPSRAIFSKTFVKVCIYKVTFCNSGDNTCFCTDGSNCRTAHLLFALLWYTCVPFRVRFADLHHLFSDAPGVQCARRTTKVYWRCAFPSLTDYGDQRRANCTQTLSTGNHQFRFTRVYTGKTNSRNNVPITPPYSLQLLPPKANLYTTNTATNSDHSRQSYRNFSHCYIICTVAPSPLHWLCHRSLLSLPYC
jgi:hypothetical protein